MLMIYYNIILTINAACCKIILSKMFMLDKMDTYLLINDEKNMAKILISI